MFHNDVLKTINFCVFLSTYTHYKNTLISIDRAVVRSTRAQISDRIVQIHTINFLQIYHGERTTEHLVHKMGHLRDSGLFAAKLEYFLKIEFIET